MPQPPRYERDKDFTLDFGNETDHSALNAEFDSAANSINDIRANLAILQADDGKLRPFVVTSDSLSAELITYLINGAAQGAADAATLASTKAAEAVTSSENASDSADAAAVSAAAAQAAQMAANSDAMPEGATNLYFTYARVRDTVLTGLSTATNAVIEVGDSILIAFGKLQAQVSSLLIALADGLAEKVSKTGDETIAGVKTFSSSPIVPTVASSDNSTKAASTAFVQANKYVETQIQTITASVAANALTVTYGGGTLDFRNATLTNGTPNSNVSVPSNAITIPSGATLGTVNGIAARLIFLEAYNGGSPVLCAANLAGGLNLDETALISPTTISSGATSVSTIYSASAVSANSPFRVVGFLDITEATAGIWATSPTKVQGVGGQALAAMSSVGYGQTWQDVKASRTVGTTYYNTTGRPIQVYVSGMMGTAGAAAVITINGVVTLIGCGVPSANTSAVNGIVPPGGSYIVAPSAGGFSGINTWAELR